MVYIKVKETTKQAKAFLDYAESLPFVEIITPDTHENELKEMIREGLIEAGEIMSGKRKGISLKKVLHD